MNTDSNAMILVILHYLKNLSYYLPYSLATLIHPSPSWFLPRKATLGGPVVEIILENGGISTSRLQSMRGNGGQHDIPSISRSFHASTAVESKWSIGNKGKCKWGLSQTPPVAGNFPRAEFTAEEMIFKSFFALSI